MNPAALPASSPRAREAVLVFITMLWGGTFLAVQTGLQWAGPYTFVGLRFGLAALIIALLRHRTLAQITGREWRAGVTVGTALFFGYSLQTVGLAYISSSKSAFLTALYVPMVPLAQWLWWRRTPGTGAWVGIGLAFAGTVLLAGPTGISWSFGAGDLLTIASALAIAMEILLLSRCAPGCDPGRLAFVQTLTVALLCLPVALLRAEGLPQPTPMLVALVAGLAAMTALIQYAMSWAQQAVSATRATLIYSLEPVWAGLVGWIAGERLGWLGLAGGALIVLGILAPEFRWPRWKRATA